MNFGNLKLNDLMAGLYRFVLFLSICSFYFDSIQLIA